jgi:hypothetical protein
MSAGTKHKQTSELWRAAALRHKRSFHNGHIRRSIAIRRPSIALELPDEFFAKKAIL